MRILILGSAGYLGTATYKALKKRGHKVFGIDNGYKKKIEKRNGIKPLWESEENTVDSEIDIASPKLKKVIKEFKPDAIVHYGEQPSAPYSLKGKSQAIDTQKNNILGSLNLIWAVNEINPNIHIVKLGSMGEYGTPNIDIEEGWLDIEHKGRKDRILFPKKPSSFYHCSKVADSVNLEFACRIWGLRVTDLNQGIVYGSRDNFHYDEMFGTVLNRFIAQAVIGHELTVYGKGTQKRACLHIDDTIQCVELACLNPAKKGEFRVFNQYTEAFSINELAEKVIKLTGAKIKNYPNPRVEEEEHYYQSYNNKLIELGLKPKLLTDEVLQGMINVVKQHIGKIDVSYLAPKTQWIKASNKKTKK